MSKKKKKQLMIFFPILAVFISAFLIAWIYGMATVALGGETIIPLLNLDLYIFIVLLGSGMVSIFIALMFKGKENYQ